MYTMTLNPAYILRMYDLVGSINIQNGINIYITFILLKCYPLPTITNNRQYTSGRLSKQ